MRSKKAVTSGWSGDLLLVHVEELRAAGHEHRQNVLLFMPFVFPVVLQQTDDGSSAAKAAPALSAGLPVALTSSGRVMGLRTFIFRATSAISSVTMDARPQYSGSSVVRMPFLAGNAVCDHTGPAWQFSRGTARPSESRRAACSHPAGTQWVCSWCAPFLCRCSVFCTVGAGHARPGCKWRTGDCGKAAGRTCAAPTTRLDYLRLPRPDLLF